MCDVQEINNKIEELREELQKLVKEKTTLLDEEVIIASKTLDETLNEYNNLIKE